MALQFNEIYIVLATKEPLLSNIYFRILCEYTRYSDTIQNNIDRYEHNYLLLNSKTLMYNAGERDIEYIICSANLVKCILISFNPKYECVEQPEINEIIIQRRNMNKTPTIYNHDEILTFEIFGRTIFLVPLSSDFTSWENIYDAFNNPLKNMLGNGIILDSKIYLDTTLPLDNFTINITLVELNELQIERGKNIVLK